MMRFRDFEALGVRIAAISDRQDGDCGFHFSDGGEARRRFLASCGIDETAVVQARQVHGARVAAVGPADAGRGTIRVESALPETDALVTDTPGLALGIRVADCVPVYLFDPVRRVIGLVHAGREGTVLNISGAAVEVMGQDFGVTPGTVHALIGPSAGPAAYEVSEELARAFTDAGLPARGRMLDLWGANVQQLAAAGIPESQIRVAGECTMTGGRYHSHRTHGDGQRNLAILMV